MEKTLGTRFIFRADDGLANYVLSKPNISEYLRQLVERDMRQKQLPIQCRKK